MFGDIYPMKYMGKTTDMFGSLKVWPPPTSAKLLDITYKSYGFSVNLIEAIE